MMALVSVMATAAFAAPDIIEEFLAESSVNTVGNPFDDSAFEPAMLATDGTVVYFGESNRTTGNVATQILSHNVVDDTTAVPSTVVTIGSDANTPANGTILQAIINDTGWATPPANVNFRQGGDTDGTTLYVGFGTQGGASEFVGAGDQDYIAAVTIATGATSIVCTSDGVFDPTLVGGTLFCVGATSEGAGEDAIYTVSAAAVSASATVAAGIGSAEINAALGSTGFADIESLARTPAGDLLVGISDVDGDITDDPILLVTDPAGSPSISVFLTGPQVDALGVGDIEPQGLTVSQAGYTVITYGTSAGDGGVVVLDASLATTVFDATATATITSGFGAPNLEIFNDNVVATDSLGSGLVVLLDSQDHSEFIARLTYLGAMPVELSVFSVD